MNPKNDEKDIIDIFLEKTKCKACLETQNIYLEKVNWDKFIIEDVQKQLSNKICEKHLLRDILMLSGTIDEVKEKLRFHTTKSPIKYTECCTTYLPTLINQKEIHRKKSEEFINEVVKYVLTAKNKLFKSLKPHILKKYMKNAPLDIEFYGQFKLTDKYFPICIENGYPYKESLEACFKKKRAKDILGYIELIIVREKKIFQREEKERLEMFGNGNL